MRKMKLETVRIDNFLAQFCYKGEEKNAMVSRRERRVGSKEVVFVLVLR